MDAISDVSRGSEIFSSVPVFSPLPNPLDLDDLFGFSAAARNKLVEEKVDTKYFIANKIFINQIDSFTGKHILSLLSGRHKDIKDDSCKGEPKGNTIKTGNQVTKSRDEKCYTVIRSHDSIPSTIMRETSIDSQDSCLDNDCIYDPSKLTVAEYYEMMEFESLESKNVFMKDKLGKCYVNSVEINMVTNELDSSLHDKMLTTNVQELNFEFVGTLIDTDLEDVEGVKEIIRTTYDDPVFFEQLVTCGIIIYCVNENLDQSTEASWVLNSIISFMNDMNKNQYPLTHCSPIFILVSTFMTWSKTKPLSLDEELPFIEKDYRKRKPHPNYKDVYDLEEMLIKAKFDHKLRSAIVLSGILYGHEENELRYLFERALCYHNLPVFSHGNNIVPVIHVENFGKIVKEVITRIDFVTTPFIFAKDPIQSTMIEISKAISLSLGTGYCEFLCKEAAFINDFISQDVYNKVMTNISLESCYPIFKEEDIQWKYESGFIENVEYIVKEFIDAGKIKPLRIIFYGGSKNEQSKSTVQRISNHYNIPYICPINLICEYVDEVLEKQVKYEEQKLINISEAHNINNLNISNQPPKSILCGDDKYIEKELEILKYYNIHSSDEAKLLQASDQIRIVSRRLNMRPYIYHGYIMEEYPESLVQANILFSGNSKEIIDNILPAQISTFPDIVIFFNEIKTQTLVEQTSQLLQGNEEHGFESHTALKPLKEEIEQNNVENASVEVDWKNKVGAVNTMVNDIANMSGATDTASHKDMFLFFSDIHKQCFTITIDISESDNEDRIFNRIISVIRKCYFPRYHGIVNVSSLNEQTQYAQNISDKENQTDKMSQFSSKLVRIENKNIDRLKETEELTLAIKSYPLISYLINFISPILTNAILEVTAQMPKDPIDSLAEYIFKNNSSGRMMPQNEIKIEQLGRNQKKPFPQIDSKACLS